MEIIERYIYTVCSYLPRSYRYGAEKKLHKQIRTLLEESDERDGNKKVNQILIELGDPEELAHQLQEAQHTALISPKIYYKYVSVLKLIEVSIIIGISMATILYESVGGYADFGALLRSYFTLLTSAMAQGFLWVTLIFAALDLLHIPFGDYKESQDSWSISDLPPLPTRLQKAHRYLTVAGMVVATILVTALLFAPEIFALYLPGESGYQVIPFFVGGKFRQIEALVLGIFILSILKGTLKLLYRKWKFSSAMAFAVLNLVSLVFIIVFVNTPQIVNPNLALAIEQYFVLDYSVSLLFADASMVLTWLFVVVYLLDSAFIIYNVTRMRR
ncbi:MAG: hypothetical protein ACRDBX_07350 [Erysipelotrichaceae bacterium]